MTYNVFSGTLNPTQSISTTGSALVGEDEDTGNSNPKNGRHW